MLEQVRLKEVYTDTGGTQSTRRVFAFGNHPMATSDDEHAVTSAAATGNSLRVIIDELLVGNYLEEIQCRGVVDDDAFDTVPVGTTPDDIAKCSVIKDLLPQTCTGDHAVCLCKNDAGCGGVAKGQPVGVLDVNQDGAADNTSFKKDAVKIQCGTINVPLDLDMSYWNPSGDQQVPAMGGFDALGPAVVLVPQVALPTNQTCGLVFATDVVDKQGIQVCAPAGGRPADCTGFLGDCPQTCNPGDTSAFSFKVEALSFQFQGASEGDVGISRTDPIFISANAPIDMATIAQITVTPSVAFTATLLAPQQIKLTWTAGLAAMTAYTITVPTTVTDTFGQSAPAAAVIHFTTGA